MNADSGTPTLADDTVYTVTAQSGTVWTLTPAPTGFTGAGNAWCILQTVDTLDVRGDAQFTFDGCLRVTNNARNNTNSTWAIVGGLNVDTLEVGASALTFNGPLNRFDVRRQVASGQANFPFATTVSGTLVASLTDAPSWQPELAHELDAQHARGDHRRQPRVDGPCDEGLVALPGRQPLIKRAFRPPNYETPLAGLRTPYTSNDVFFVRYHLANIPEFDARDWRLQVGGASIARPLSLSLAHLKRDYEQVTVNAINQCSGNRRGLFTPRVPGVQWGYGAMGNARWGGVRLRDILRTAGLAADAVEVSFDGADTALMPKTPDFARSLRSGAHRRKRAGGA